MNANRIPQVIWRSTSKEFAEEKSKRNRSHAKICKSQNEEDQRDPTKHLQPEDPLMKRTKIGEVFEAPNSSTPMDNWTTIWTKQANCKTSLPSPTELEFHALLWGSIRKVKENSSNFICCYFDLP